MAAKALSIEAQLHIRLWRSMGGPTSYQSLWDDFEHKQMLQPSWWWISCMFLPKNSNQISLEKSLQMTRFWCRKVGLSRLFSVFSALCFWARNFQSFLIFRRSRLKTGLARLVFHRSRCIFGRCVSQIPKIDQNDWIWSKNHWSIVLNGVWTAEAYYQCCFTVIFLGKCPNYGDMIALRLDYVFGKCVPTIMSTVRTYIHSFAFQPPQKHGRIQSKGLRWPEEESSSRDLGFGGAWPHIDILQRSAAAHHPSNLLPIPSSTKIELGRLRDRG